VFLAAQKSPRPARILSVATGRNRSATDFSAGTGQIRLPSGIILNVITDATELQLNPETVRFRRFLPVPRIQREQEGSELFVLLLRLSCI